MMPCNPAPYRYENIHKKCNYGNNQTITYTEYLQTLFHIFIFTELCVTRLRARRLTQTFRPRGSQQKDIHRKSKYKNNAMKIYMEYLLTLGYLLLVVELYMTHAHARRLMQTFGPRGLQQKDIHRKSKYKNIHMKIYNEYLQTLGYLRLVVELYAMHVRARRFT